MKDNLIAAVAGGVAAAWLIRRLAERTVVPS